MISSISAKWRQLRSESTSWRPLSEDGFWNDYDACIATTTMGRGRAGNSFEVWTFGQLIAQCASLAEAKAAVEDVYGPLTWQTISLPKVPVIHKYYGPTTEFTEPNTIHVVEELPKLL